jgi:hypothetical protein
LFLYLCSGDQAGDKIGLSNLIRLLAFIASESEILRLYCFTPFAFSFTRSEVFIWYPFLRKKIEKLPRFDGIASSPSWHPNGKSLVLTLSRKGNKDIQNTTQNTND